MSLAQDEPITTGRIRVMRIHAEHVPVQRRQQIRDAEATPDVRHVGAVHHPERVSADARREAAHV
jgi:hypothetical protein